MFIILFFGAIICVLGFVYYSKKILYKEIDANDKTFEDRKKALETIFLNVTNAKTSEDVKRYYKYRNMYTNVSYDDHYRTLLKKNNPWLLYPKELTDYLEVNGMDLGLTK